MGEDSGEKTEEPTPHKLSEARKKGQIAKSKELTAAVLMIVSFYSLKIFAIHIWENLSMLTRSIMEAITLDFTIVLAGSILMEVLLLFFKMILPVFFIIFFAALVTELMQTGFLISVEPIMPKLSKINPIEGVKKYFTLKQYVEILKSIIKMTVVVFIIINAIEKDIQLVFLSQSFTLWQTMFFVAQLVMKVITRVTIFYFFVAILDFLYQRYEYIKGLKMSTKEIKDEYKRLEGDPTIKQRQREIQREMSQGRQSGAVPGADVVVTNPIHYAVALKYDEENMTAPKVVAKGKRLFAQEIKTIADSHLIPIIENPPLARQLFANANIDQEVPPEFYRAVAEILAFVYNLKRQRKLQR
tara:strand:+ start:4494 stop:5564 length:1071 start_codon:yes stop_codon:yes gene_type:complete